MFRVARNKPCYGQTGTANHTSSAGDDSRYNGYTFTEEAVSVIEAHGHVHGPAGKPLFLYYAIHNTHSPVQAPLRIQVCGPPPKRHDMVRLPAMLPGRKT